MTVQDLLQEATQLSLKEQLQLATQLLQLVDRQLANPVVINSPSAMNPVAVNLDTQENSIGYLLANPILVRRFKPLSRDEIYDRC